jgi:drug/metabolite transporter (DMT)-like permease
MDAMRVRQGRLIAGVGGLLLFGFLFLPWFGQGGGNSTGWEGQSSTDIFLLITAMVAVAAFLPGSRASLVPGVSMSGAAAVLGGVATIILIWLAFIDFPSGADRKLGVYLALLAAIVIAIGGYMSTHDAPVSARARR